MDKSHIFEQRCKILREAISQLSAIQYDVKHDGYLEEEFKEDTIKLRNIIDELSTSLGLKNLTWKEKDDLRRNIAHNSKGDMSKYYEPRYNRVLEFASLYCKSCHKADDDGHNDDCPVGELESKL